MNYQNVVLLHSCVLFVFALFPICRLIGLHYDKTEANDSIWNNVGRSTLFNDWTQIAAHPWLTSNHSSTTLFRNLYNDLDQLLMFMSNKTNKIALLRFSYPWQTMLQNQIYTLVRFGQVYNYIVMVGDEKSLAACIELRLPCYNGTGYYKNYYQEVDPTVDAAVVDIKHYQPMVWFKLRFYRDVLIRNYTILACDTDIAFSRKNIWLSLEKYSEDVGNCDMVFMHERPVNTGFFYSRSNARTLTLFNRWIHSEGANWHLNDQGSFSTFRGYYYVVCHTREECDTTRQRKMTPIGNNAADPLEMEIVTVRTFPSSYHAYTGNICPTYKRVNPCLDTTAFIHTVCTIGQSTKIQTMKLNGFWLMQEHCNVSSIHSSTGNDSVNALDIYLCEPLVFKDPNVEKEFENCNNEIAWTK